MNDLSVVPDSPLVPVKKKSKILIILSTIIFIFIIAFFIIRPGVFSIQPIGALPKGITFIYHSRNPEMSFFESPDGMCLKNSGSVTLLCRGIALSAVEELTERIIIRLPYIHWAYLRSTGGQEFSN